MGFSNGSDTIEIRVQVDNTGAVKLLGETEKQIGKIGEASKKAKSTSDEFFSGIVKGASAAIGSYVSLAAAIRGIERGAAVDDLSQGFETLAKQAGIASDVLLNQLRKATAGTISDFDLMQRANESLLAGLDPTRYGEVATQTRKLSETLGVDLKEALDLVNDALVRGNDMGLKKRLGLNVDLQASELALKQAYGNTGQELSENAKLQAHQIAIYAALEEKTKGLADVTDDADDKLKQIRNSLINGADAALKKAVADKALNEQLDNLKTLVASIPWDTFISGITKATVATGSFIDRAGTSLAATIENLTNFIKDPSFKNFNADVLRDKVKPLNEELNKVIDTLSKGTPEAIEKAKARFTELGAEIDKQGNLVKNVLMPEYQKVAQNFPEIADGAKKVTTETKKQGDTAKDLADEYRKLVGALGSGGLVAAQKASTEAAKQSTEALKDADAQVVAYEKHVAELTQTLNTSIENLGGFNLGSIFTDDKALQTQLNDAGSIIASGLVDAISSAISGDELSKEQIGQSIGSTVGAAAATAMGAPELAPIASQLGAAVGDFLSTAFGSDSAGTQAKKALDATITEVFKDLQFSGNQNPLEGLFADLPAQAQAAYTAVGDAITGALGQGTDLGVNLGVVLANNNLTLADTQALLEALGLGFNELSDAMYQAFYDGELSALDLQNRLEEIYGIINGSTAFENLGAAVNEAFSADGRTLLNALRGIGQQAQATGVTLGSMPDILVNKFGVAADRVQQLMSAMAAAGIKSVADLANAANPVLVALAANIIQAQQGIAPDNTAVVTPNTTSSGSSSKSVTTAPSTRTSNSKTKTDPNAKVRSEIEKAFNQVLNSGIGKDFDEKLSQGFISDEQWTKGINSLVEQAKKLNSDIEEAKRKYIEDVRKHSKNTEKDLLRLDKLKGELDVLLKGSDKEDTIYSKFNEFTKQFKGNIELIQAAAKGLNLSFKDMKTQALDAFLAGSKTFAEAKNALDDISGGKDPKKQLEAFKALGANGGQYSVDALRKIAQASINSGGSDLNSLSEQLLGGGANREDVQKLFIALQNTGVNSLDQIANAGTDLAINIGAALQDVGFNFATTTSTVRSELQALDALIQQNRKMTIDVDVNYTDDARLVLGIPDNYSKTSQGIPSTTTGAGRIHKNSKVKSGKHKGKFTTDNKTYHDTNFW